MANYGDNGDGFKGMRRCYTMVAIDGNDGDGGTSMCVCVSLWGIGL